MPDCGGVLYVVATPIGNLADLSPRAAQVLRDCDVVYAEDTRRTRVLLTHLQIQGKPLQALHAHSSAHSIQRAVARVAEGAAVAVVTDAGTPAVSDPGNYLVRECHRAGLKVVAVAGPSAVTTAVSASGLVEGPFLFLGFLPRRGARRDALLQRIARSTEPCVLFEAPNRLGDTLKELAELIGEREACVARELSKLHEELRPGTLSELAEHGAWRGECTLVIAAAPERPQLDAATDDTALQAEIVTALRAGAGTRALAEALAERLGRPRKQMYALVLQGRSAAGTDHGESD